MLNDCAPSEHYAFDCANEVAKSCNLKIKTLDVTRMPHSNKWTKIDFEHEKIVRCPKDTDYAPGLKDETTIPFTVKREIDEQKNSWQQGLSNTSSGIETRHSEISFKSTDIEINSASLLRDSNDNEMNEKDERKGTDYRMNQV